MSAAERTLAFLSRFFGGLPKAFTRFLRMPLTRLIRRVFDGLCAGNQANFTPAPPCAILASPNNPSPRCQMNASHHHGPYRKPVKAPPKPVTAAPRPIPHQSKTTNTSARSNTTPVQEKSQASSKLGLVMAICLPIVIIILIPVLLSQVEERSPEERTTTQRDQAEERVVPVVSERAGTVTQPLVMPNGQRRLDFEIFRAPIHERGLDNILLKESSFTNQGFRFSSADNPNAPDHSRYPYRLPARLFPDPGAPEGRVVTLGVNFRSRQILVERVDGQLFSMAQLRLFVGELRPHVRGNLRLLGMRNGQTVHTYERPLSSLTHQGDFCDLAPAWNGIDLLIIDFDQRVEGTTPWIASLWVAP